MQEGEAHGAGSDVMGTPLRAEEKTSVVPVWEGAARMRCRLGEMQKRGETRQATQISVVMRQRDKAKPEG